jgi:hypothetical protein
VVWTSGGGALRLHVRSLSGVSWAGFDFFRWSELVGFLVLSRVFAAGRVSGVDRRVLLIFSLVRGGTCKLLAATLGVALCSTARPTTHPDGGIVGQKS